VAKYLQGCFESSLGEDIAAGERLQGWIGWFDEVVAWNDGVHLLVSPAVGEV
jgi:hypothetical protein